MDRTSEIALAETLSDLGTLDGLDHPRLEAIAELVRALDHQNDEAIQKCYCSARWWGGAGSMFDYIPDKNRRRYLELLLALVGAFEAAGFNCPDASSRAAIIQEWLDKKII